MRRYYYALIMLLMVGTVQAKDAAQDSQLAKIKAKIDNLKQIILQKQDKRAALTNDLGKLEQKINDSSNDLRQINQNIKDQNTLLQPLLDQQKDLENLVAQERAQLAKQLRAAYQEGEHGALELLFGGEDPQKVERTMIYYQAINTARVDLIKNYLDHIEAIKRNQVTINQRMEQLQKLQAAQLAANNQLKTQEQSRTNLLKQINAQIETNQQRIAQLEADKKRLENVVNNLNSDTNFDDVRGVAFNKLKGRLPWPVAGQIVRAFGQVYDGQLISNGVFIRTGNNQSVRAIASGQVIFADYLKGYGNLIIVSHKGGYMTLYAHNNALFKSVGDNVEAGDEVSLAGLSGGLSDSGLYFEIRYQGKPVNPSTWCRGVPG